MSVLQLQWALHILKHKLSHLLHLYTPDIEIHQGWGFRDIPSSLVSSMLENKCKQEWTSK